MGGISAFLVNISGPGDHTPFLNKMYLGFFNRPPDAPGLAFWSQGLDSGVFSEGFVALSFYNSLEFFFYDFPIATAYLGVEGIDVTYAELNLYLPQFRSGSMASQSCLSSPPPYNTIWYCSQLTLIQINMTSSQFQSVYGSLTNSQFVQTLYLNLFGQSPSSQETSFLLGQLSGGYSRAQVIQSLIDSTQYVNQEYNHVLVDAAYMAILSRNPDPSGFQFWMNALNDGLAPQNFLALFVSSYEFQKSL